MTFPATISMHKRDTVPVTTSRGNHDCGGWLEWLVTNHW
jgi:hypothetical protein